MKSFLLIVAMALIANVSFAKDRQPTSDGGIPNYPGVTYPGTSGAGATTPAAGAGAVTTAFISEDVQAAGGSYVQSVYCITGASSGYQIYNGNYVNDLRVARVSAGGSISYEIYRGTRFLGACSQIQVIGK